MSYEKVQTAINHGANVNGKNKSGYSPLFECVFSIKEEKRAIVNKIALLLIQKGANSNESFAMGRLATNTLICIATSGGEGSSELINEVLKNENVNIDGKDGMSHTALLWTVKADNKSIVELLISRGAKIESYFGNNLSYYAESKEVKSMIKSHEGCCCIL